MRAMDGVMGELFAPLARAKPPPGGWHLVDWDSEQGLCLTFARGDHFLLVELEARDDERPCFARTRRFNVCARRLFAGDAPPLSAAECRPVEQLVELVRSREDQLPRFERPAVTRRTAVREIRVDRVLVSEGAGQYYMNPYVGCMIGCEFCYVAERADLSRELAGLPRIPWGRYVDVKVNAPEVLAQEVRERPPGPVRMSPIITDPYQPLERTHRITRRCLEVLLEAGFAPVILTRAARVVDDLDLLARFPRAAVGLSIPTDDDSVRRQFEPGADPIEERLDAIARLHSAGVRTFAVIQPMLPMDPERLASRLAPHIQLARIDRMHSIERAMPLYRTAGREAASRRDFFDDTERRLRSAFGAAGVRHDDMDDMARLVAQ